MTIRDDVQKWQDECENEIRDALQKFSDETGLVPVGLVFEPVDATTINGPDKVIISRVYLKANTGEVGPAVPRY